MKAYFPYYFRKFGIALVLISIVISMIGGINDFEKGFVMGQNFIQGKLPGEYLNKYVDENHTKPMHYEEIISSRISRTLTWIGASLSFIGFLLYMFSREKTEDELIRKLRYKSLEKSLIITWVAAFIFLLFKNKVNLDAYSILQLQFFAYVFIYLYYKEKYEIK